jgi:hypothetical protein
MAKPWRPKTISFEGGSNNPCRMWNLESKKEEDTVYFRLLDGVINNITASNVNEWVTVQQNGFLVLSVNSSGGSLTEFALEFSSTMPPPIADAENIPPPQFKMFFARVLNFQAVARFNSSLSILPAVSRQEGVIPTQPGQRNFKNFYTWQINVN